ncbi:MAG: zinc ABC transporter substrate-binding protein [Nitrospira sp.]|nr:zinc ABC transporter substrate-binding protein [Nitrospira sp.]
MTFEHLLSIGVFLLVLTGYSSCFVPAAQARDPIPIVVTLPVLKDLTEQVGGPFVRVKSLLNGYENEHTYSPKPSDLVAVRKAQLLFEVGLGLEVWVTALVKNAGSAKLRVITRKAQLLFEVGLGLEVWVTALVKNAGSAKLRVITTSQGVELLHDGGDVHEEAHSGMHEAESGGNPHIWLDPINVGIMLGHITQALIDIDPVHAAEFQANQEAYLQRIKQLQQELMSRTQRLSDRRFVAHHPAWPYLAKRFGLEIVDTIHTQSGTEPSALHLRHLIAKINRQHIRVIASEIQLSQRLPELLARDTKARVVVLTTMPGGVPGTESYLDMLRYNVLQLVGALEST